MKNFRLIILFAAAVALLAGCDKHDKLDDLVYVGKMAPQLQWTVTSTTINAGNSVPFTARYYTTAKTPISHLEVWYNITEVENKSVSAPFVTSFSYTIASEKTVERRINQKISEYPHDESRWNDKERSYNFEESFPTSSTLSKVSFGAADWDSLQVIAYFGEDFMQNFKDSLYQILFVNTKGSPEAVDKVFGDLRTLYSQMGGDGKDFVKLYVDSTYNENTTLYDKHFKNHEIPQALDSLYQTTSFADLIYNSTGASISYSKQFKLSAELRCYDTEGTYGKSLSSEITLN